MKNSQHKSTISNFLRQHDLQVPAMVLPITGQMMDAVERLTQALEEDGDLGGIFESLLHERQQCCVNEMVDNSRIRANGNVDTLRGVEKLVRGILASVSTNSNTSKPAGPEADSDAYSTSDLQPVACILAGIIIGTAMLTKAAADDDRHEAITRPVDQPGLTHGSSEREIESTSDVSEYQSCIEPDVRSRQETMAATSLKSQSGLNMYPDSYPARLFARRDVLMDRPHRRTGRRSRTKSLDKRTIPTDARHKSSIKRSSDKISLRLFGRPSNSTATHSRLGGKQNYCLAKDLNGRIAQHKVRFGYDRSGRKRQYYKKSDDNFPYEKSTSTHRNQTSFDSQARNSGSSMKGLWLKLKHKYF